MSAEAQIKSFEKLENIVPDEAPILYGILQPGPDLPEGVPYVRPTEIVEDVIELESVRRTSPAIAVKYKRSLLRPNDIILSIVGTIGKVAIVPPDLDGGNITQSSVRIRVRPEIALSRYVAWALRSPILTRQYDKYRLGTAVPRLNVAHVRALEIPLPNLDEQRRIVAEIEKQFTRLDAGVAALRRVQANLKRYRAAVLKAACEGRLVPTEAELAGKEGRTYETGEQLLQRILAERRRRWVESNHKNGNRKYSEPDPADVAGLASLPEGWTSATLDALAAVKGGITKDQKRKHSAPARLVPYLRVANVQRGYLDLTEMKEIVAAEDEIQELALQPGDILFNEGGDRDKLGRGWIWSGQLPECIHQNHVFRARLFDPTVNPKFVSWYGNTFGQRFFFDEGKHTTNLASISMTKLRRLPVPIPPAAEQTRIVAEVERRLSVVEELEAVVTANLQRATRLRQAILQNAFSGQL
jgi:type I restriction enzyme, S subunit